MMYKVDLHKQNEHFSGRDFSDVQKLVPGNQDEIHKRFYLEPHVAHKPGKLDSGGAFEAFETRGWRRALRIPWTE